jgi:hypothetical protein
MKGSLKATLVGGPQNGQTVELAHAAPETTIQSRVLERNGEWRVIYTSKYKLNEQCSPLRYEFQD